MMLAGYFVTTALRNSAYYDRAKICLTVHDSIVADCKDKETLDFVAPLLKRVMESVKELAAKHTCFDTSWITVPIVVDVVFGHNWYDMEEYDFKEE